MNPRRQWRQSSRKTERGDAVGGDRHGDNRAIIQPGALDGGRTRQQTVGMRDRRPTIDFIFEVATAVGKRPFKAMLGLGEPDSKRERERKRFGERFVLKDAATNKLAGDDASTSFSRVARISMRPISAFDANCLARNSADSLVFCS